MATVAATITMTMREADRLKTVQAVVEPDASGWPGRAAAWHEPTAGGAPRDRYIDEGPSGLISRRRGRPSNNQLAPGVAGRAIAIIRERYADFGPTLAAEKLQECHGVVLSKETVRALMVSAGLWMPRRQRAPKIHQPRNRRHCLGELIQIDGSDHAWFEERAPACTLSCVHRRRHQPADAAALRAHRIELCLLRGDPRLPGGPRQTGGVLQRRRASSGRCRSRSFSERGVTQFGRGLYELNIELVLAMQTLGGEQCQSLFIAGSVISPGHNCAL
jgi:hypothetical protein